MFEHMLYGFLGMISTLYLTRSFRALAKSPVRHATTFSIQNLLHPPNTTTAQLLSERAIPNERLRRAFRLTNTFVSPSVDIHRAFVGRAASLLRTAQAQGKGWQHFQEAATQAVQASLPNSACDFDAFVEGVTLRTILVGFLDVGWTSFAEEDITIVATHITRLWSLSKRPEPIPLSQLDTLNFHLRRLIPDEQAYPNPLDFVIPVWETLWRVVVTVLAHVHNDDRGRHIFADFHQNPTDIQFRAYESDQTPSPSVQAFVAEAMRLHPPSKHIGRAKRYPHPLLSMLPSCVSAAFPQLLGPMCHDSADIETVQRSGVWGSDCTMFDPTRHHPLRLIQAQEATLLAFGYGKLKCIAAGWAPVAVGVIVAAILDIVDGKTYEIVAGAHIGGREGWEGWSVRLV